MARDDYGLLESHGLVNFAYDEKEGGITGHDFGALEDHGLANLAYEVDAAPELNTDLVGRLAIPPMWEHMAGGLQRTLDADGEKLAYCFPVHQSGTITDIEFYVGAFTKCDNGLTVSIETVGTDGLPTGTNYGGSSPATGVSVGAVGWFTATLATGATATKGDRVAVVITWTTWVSGNNIGIRCAAYGLNSYGYPMVATYESAAWVWRAHYKLTGALKYGSTYYPDDPLFGGQTTSDYYHSTSVSVDESGNKFQLPVGCRVTGAWLMVGISNSNIRVRIYDSSSVVLAQVVIPDLDEVSNQVRQVSLIDFPTPCELEANTVYRIAIEVLDDTEYLTLYSITPATTAMMEALPLGSNCIRSFRSNGGSWNDDNTERMCLGLIVDQLRT